MKQTMARYMSCACVLPGPFAAAEVLIHTYCTSRRPLAMKLQGFSTSTIPSYKYSGFVQPDPLPLGVGSCATRPFILVDGVWA